MNNAPTEVGLWEDGDYREVHGLGQRFRTCNELRAKGYDFAFEYGSTALAKAMAWLEFPELGALRRIETGPLSLRDALDAAFASLESSKKLAGEHVKVLKSYTGNWFGAAAEVRRLLLTLERRNQPADHQNVRIFDQSSRLA